MITKQQRIVFSIILFFLVVGLGIAFYLAQQIAKPAPEAVAQLTFNLQEIDDPQNSADERTVAVFVSVQEAEIRTLGAVIEYDSNAVEILEVLEETQATPFSQWRYYSASDIPGQNRVELIAGKDDADDPYFTTSAPFGKIRLRLKTDQPTTLNFNDEETGGIDRGGNEVPTTTTPLTLNPAQPSGATLKLIPATGEANAGNTLSVDIVLDTNGFGIAGVEAVIEYDKNLLSVTSEEQIIIPENSSFGDYKKEIDLPTDDPSKSRFSVKALIPIPIEIGTQAEPLVGQDILVAHIDFATTNGTTGIAHVQILCISPPSPTGDFASAYACDPTPEVEDFSLVSLFDPDQPNYEGEGILTRVENGEYTITQLGITPTITPIITPTPTITVVPPTPTATILPPTPTSTIAPSPTITPQPGQTALKLALNACKADTDNLSREVYIKINGAAQQTINMHNDGITDPLGIPDPPFELKVMPIGHLPGTFTITAADIAANNIIDLTAQLFIGGNSDNTTGPTGATDLTFSGVTFNDANRNFDEQIINVSDFNFFKSDFSKMLSEQEETIRSDFNCSGKVNVLDYSSILFHWGKISSN